MEAGGRVKVQGLSVLQALSGCLSSTYDLLSKAI